MVVWGLDLGLRKPQIEFNPQILIPNKCILSENLLVQAQT